MILVKRTLPAPTVLDLNDATSPAAKELDKAEHYFLGMGNEKPNFQTYRHLSVRELLKTQFNRKCVYCECGVGAGHDGDIEHYRPKGSVSEEKDSEPPHYGYWWLAMAWENLTLSCQHCNQRRKQIVLEPGLNEEQVKLSIEKNRRQTVGKFDSFPVEKNTRAFSPDKVKDEVAYLIDPTITDPQDHIDWDFTNDLPMPIGKTEIGKASIVGYALWRSWLADDRKFIYLGLKAIKREIIKCIKDLKDEADPFKIGLLEGQMQAHLKDLQRSGASENKYAGMARAFYHKVIDEIEGLSEGA